MRFDRLWGHRAVAGLLLGMVPTASGFANDFSLDPQSTEVTVLGRFEPGDLAKQDGSGVHLSATQLGLVAADDVDAFSYGSDQLVPAGPDFFVSLQFSVDRNTVGAGGAVSHQANRNGAAGDKFDLLILRSGNSAGPFLQSDAPNHGLTPSTLGLESDLDGLSRPPGTRRPVFFSVGRGSSTANPADILYVADPGTAAPTLYASAGALGLQAGDNIDALAISDRGMPGQLDADDLVFASLDAQSPSRATFLPGGGDGVLQLFPAPAQLVIGPDQLDLAALAGEELDAMTAFDPGPASPTLVGSSTLDVPPAAGTTVGQGPLVLSAGERNDVALWLVSLVSSLFVGAGSFEFAFEDRTAEQTSASADSRDGTLAFTTRDQAFARSAVQGDSEGSALEVASEGALLEGEVVNAVRGGRAAGGCSAWELERGPGKDLLLWCPEGQQLLAVPDLAEFDFGFEGPGHFLLTLDRVFPVGGGEPLETLRRLALPDLGFPNPSAVVPEILVDGTTPTPDGGVFRFLRAPVTDGACDGFLGRDSSNATDGFYLLHDGMITKVVDEDDALPGGPVTVSRVPLPFEMDGPVALSCPNVAFVARRSFSPFFEALYTNVGGMFVKVIEAGDEIDGQVVGVIRIGRDALAGNVLTYLVTFVDSSRAVYVTVLPLPFDIRDATPRPIRIEIGASGVARNVLGLLTEQPASDFDVPPLKGQWESDGTTGIITIPGGQLEGYVEALNRRFTTPIVLPQVGSFGDGVIRVDIATGNAEFGLDGSFGPGGAVEGPFTLLANTSGGPFLGFPGTQPGFDLDFVNGGPPAVDFFCTESFSQRDGQNACGGARFGSDFLPGRVYDPATGLVLMTGPIDTQTIDILTAWGDQRWYEAAGTLRTPAPVPEPAGALLLFCAVAALPGLRARTPRLPRRGPAPRGACCAGASGGPLPAQGLLGP